ncbi:MAG: DUF167 domain-containing protein [Candidatus Norongarragalinales archaeon]
MRARVFPNAKEFCVSFGEGILKVRVCAPAEGGRANKELVRMLSKLLGVKVEVVRGLKSRDKEILFEDLSEKEVVEKVNSLSSQ